MRLWSIHPKYLDAIGLVALWREALLAKKVLQGRTKGYKYHPQILRFKSHRYPIASINSYLNAVWVEAARRGYSFDKRKLAKAQRIRPIWVTSQQLEFELNHLRRKLKKRNAEGYSTLIKVRSPKSHPLFHVRQGPVEEWEKR